MSRGPAPTPSEILNARGSWRAETRKDEPALPVKAPPCPPWLKGEGKKEWGRVTKLLVAMGVVAEIDRALLAFYCEAWAEFIEAADYIEENGHTVTLESGYVAIHPMVGVKNSAFERCVKIAAQFGFSPSARTRLRATAKRKESTNAKARFFKFPAG